MNDTYDLVNFNSSNFSSDYDSSVSISTSSWWTTQINDEYIPRYPMKSICIPPQDFTLILFVVAFVVHLLFGRIVFGTAKLDKVIKAIENEKQKSILVPTNENDVKDNVQAQENDVNDNHSQSLELMTPAAPPQYSDIYGHDEKKTDADSMDEKVGRDFTIKIDDHSDDDDDAKDTLTNDLRQDCNYPTFGLDTHDTRLNVHVNKENDKMHSDEFPDVKLSSGNIFLGTKLRSSDFGASMNALIEAISHGFNEAIENDSQHTLFANQAQDHQDVCKLIAKYSYSINKTEMAILKRWLKLVNSMRFFILLLLIKMLIRIFYLIVQIIIAAEWISSTNTSTNSATSKDKNAAFANLVSTSWLGLCVWYLEIFYFLTVLSIWLKFSKFEHMFAKVFRKNGDTFSQPLNPFRIKNDQYAMFPLYLFIGLVICIISAINIVISANYDNSSAELLLIFVLVFGVVGIRVNMQNAYHAIWNRHKFQNDEAYWQYVHNFNVSMYCCGIFWAFLVVYFVHFWMLDTFDAFCENKSIGDVFDNVTTKNIWYLTGWFFV